MKTKMEKILLAIIGLAFLSVLTDAQDIGSMRRLMLLRQRDIALRRAGFPFGIRGVGGPGIPPPAVAARLAMIERQRALRGRFLGSPLGPLVTPFSPFVSGPFFGPGPFGLSGPTGLSRFDLSTLSFPTEATFGGPEGMPISTTGGMATVGQNSMATIGSGGPTGVAGQQGGSGNIFGQQPTQVFPNVPAVVQIPSVTPTAQGQPGEGQVGLTQAGEGQMTGLTGGQGSSTVGGQVTGPMGGNIGGTMTGTMGGSVSGPIGGSMGGAMGGAMPGGPMGGAMGGPISGGPMGGAIGGPMSGGSMGGAMGGPMSGGPMGGAMGGPMSGGPMGGVMGGPISGGSMGGAIGGTMSGGPMGGAMGGPMSGGSMIGSIGGSVGGAMGGPMSGGPIGGPVSGPMRGSVGGATRGPMSGGLMGGAMGGPFGGPIRGPMIGPMRGPGVGPFRGPTGSPLGSSVGGSFGSQFTGPRFSFTQPSGGQFSTGTQTQGQGSAIFPSQATQGPVIRQRGPGFSTDSSLSTGLDLSGSSTIGIPGFPNGPAPLFPGGAPGFGQSDQIMFPAGGFSPDLFSGTELQSSGFPGFSTSSFGQRFGVTGSESSRPTFVPSFDATPTGPGMTVSGSDAISSGQSFRPVTFGPSIDATATGQTAGQSLGGSASQGQVTTSFGFVDPSNNAAAGPAFNTGSQSTQNFNIQFQPLQPGTVPQIPAPQPNQGGQIGIGGAMVQSNTGMTSDLSNQGNIQFGSSGQGFQSGSSSQGGLQFGGSSQSGIQTVSTDQNSKFIVSGGPTVVETRPNQQNGGITSGSTGQSSNSAATTVSERTVETGGSGTENTEFRLVEVGNILGDKGFVNNDAGSSTVVVKETISSQQGPGFQPVGDINTAFRSFESVAGSNNVVDLSLEPTVTMTENAVSTSDATGSTIVTNKTETKSIMSVQEGPFAASLNQDFSFFMTENTNNQAPNEMPPITFNAPMPPLTGSEGPAVLTFAVEGVANTDNEMPTISTQDLSSASNSFTITSGGKTVLGPEQSGTSAIVSETTPSSVQV